jgi:hypothetical protein
MCIFFETMTINYELSITFDLYLQIRSVEVPILRGKKNTQTK